MKVTSDIQLYDTEIIAIDRGPLAWAVTKQGTAMDLDEFVRTFVGKFEQIGLRTRVNTYDTTERGTYAFEVVIQGRVDDTPEFDFDRMVHEVQNNVLDDPDDPGIISTVAAEKKFRADNPDRRGPNHGHGPGACTC